MKPPRMIVPNATKDSQKIHDERTAKVLSNISFGGSVASVAPAPGGATRMNDPESNIDGDRLTVTSPAAPNTEFAVSHTLGRIPMGFVFHGGSNPGIVYRGPTPWSKTQIFLKETQGTNAFVITIV